MAAFTTQSHIDSMSMTMITNGQRSKTTREKAAIFLGSGENSGMYRERREVI